MTTMTTVNIGKKQDPIVLTDSARKKVADLLAQESVRTPWCSGSLFAQGDAPATATRCSSTPRRPMTMSSASTGM